MRINTKKGNLVPNLFQQNIPPKFKKEFQSELIVVNYFRSRNLSALLLLLITILIFTDIDNLLKGHWETVPGYRFLFYGHLLLGAGLLVALIYSIIFKLNRENAMTSYRQIFVLLFSFGISISCAFISIADQLIHGEITVYLLCAFGLAIINYQKPSMNFVIYGLSFLIFILGITNVQDNPDILRGHYINGTVLVVLALFLSTILYFAKVREFLSTKTIEQQKDELEKKNDELSATNKELNESIQALDESQNMIFSLTLTLESKDSNTHGHSERVAEIVLAIAQYLGLNENDKTNLWRAAILHDIGKIGIPDAILNKPLGLTDSEWEIMKSHPERGEGICSKLRFAREILPIIRHHHERYDGTGYPDGLAGEDIPFLARIVSIADTVDAITSPRRYRAAGTMKQAVSELKRCSGTQFDPVLVTAFLNVSVNDVKDEETHLEEDVSVGDIIA